MNIFYDYYICIIFDTTILQVQIRSKLLFLIINALD